MTFRLRAFTTHFLCSAAVLGACLAVVFLLWYPYPYSLILDAWNILMVLVGVDLVVGPLLTLLVAKQGKKSLRFDLAVIVLIQLVALVYGLHAIHSERPRFMVYNVDRFSVLAAKDVAFDGSEDPRFRARPWRGPLMLVATMPDDPAERSRLTDETLFEGKPDIDRRPEYWSLYAEAGSGVLAQARTLRELAEARPQSRAVIEASAARLGGDLDGLRFVPVVGKSTDFAVVLDPRDAGIADIIAVDPWF